MLPRQCFCQGVLGQIFQFLVKNGLFLAQKAFMGLFKFKFEINASKLTPVPNFSKIKQKVKEALILTWKNTENCLMTSYLPHSDDVSKIIIDFEKFCFSAPSCQVWW